MKLVFKKDDQSKVNVLLSHDGVTEAFDYISMVKKLIEVREMAEADISDDFSDAEKESIQSMVQQINDLLSKKGPKITQM